jgi:hypothetical protein
MAIICLLVGFIFLGVSIGISKVIEHKKRTCNQKVNAKVINMTRNRTNTLINYNHNTSWYPIYEYWVDNQRIQRCSHVGGTRKSFQIGQEVELFINPNNPKEFYNPMDQMVILKMVFMVIGFILFGFSIGLLIMSKFIL